MKSITVKLLAMAVLMSASMQSFGVDLECEPDDKRCQKEEYKITIYKQGRDEYEKARKSGDFTKVYHIASELAGMKDRRGRMMLKMVHIQLGWGKHNNLPEAYMWLDKAVKDGIDYAPKWLERITQLMTVKQLEEAKQKIANSS